MNRYVTCLLPLLALAALATTPACGDDDDDNGSTQGSGGGSGKGGSGGTGGTGGGSGTGGTGGVGGAGAGGGAGQGGGGGVALPPARPAAFDVLALGDDNKLYYFKSDAPGTVKQGTITGAAGTFDGIDVRSSDGLIYGLTDDAKLYKIEVNLSGADVVATATAGAAVSDLVVGTGGIGFDFNPKSVIAVDKGGDGGNALRVVTDEANYRLNPVNSSIAGTDTDVAYKAGDANEGKAPAIVAAGYNNAYAGTTGTVLYDIDTTTDSLVKQGDPDPNLGVLTTIGALGITVGDDAGFDIVATLGANDAVVNDAYLVHADTFYSVNLQTGAATPVGAIAGASGLKGLVVMVP